MNDDAHITDEVRDELFTNKKMRYYPTMPQKQPQSQEQPQQQECGIFNQSWSTGFVVTLLIIIGVLVIVIIWLVFSAQKKNIPQKPSNNPNLGRNMQQYHRHYNVEKDDAMINKMNTVFIKEQQPPQENEKKEIIENKNSEKEKEEEEEEEEDEF